MNTIDIVVPAYIPTETHYEYLIKALESVQKQTFTDFNLIVIINGCDFTIDHPIMSDKRFTQVTVTDKTNAATARNYGIKQGKAKYVAQLDADDLYHEQKLEIQYDFMKKNDWCSLVGTHAYVIERDGRITNSCYKSIHRTHEHIKRYIYQENPICCGSVLFRRSDIFDNNMFYNEKHKPGSIWPQYDRSMNEDWDLWIRCIESDKKIHLLPDRLYYWRRDSGVER